MFLMFGFNKNYLTKEKGLNHLKPEVDPEVGVVAVVVPLVPLHRHPLVPVGLGSPLAGKEELVQGGGVAVPVQLDSAHAIVHHARREEDEGAHLSVERVPRVVKLAGHLEGE